MQLFQTLRLKQEEMKLKKDRKQESITLSLKSIIWVFIIHFFNIQSKIPYCNPVLQKPAENAKKSFKSFESLRNKLRILNKKSIATRWEKRITKAIN